MLAIVAGVVCLTWCIGILIVCNVGYWNIYSNYRKKPDRSISERLPHDEVPPVTIIRPVKGLEPALYECLAATFRQSYPSDKINVRFCVSSRDDPSFPTLEKLLKDFSYFDAQILVEEEDAVLQTGGSRPLGPNPKIRNMSRAYREATSDIVWIIDCNVWVGPGVLGRMVDKLCGLSNDGPCMRYKFVHQLPLVVDITDEQLQRGDSALLGSGNEDHRGFAASTSTAASHTTDGQALHEAGEFEMISRVNGGRLEEMFLASSHAKFYTAINTVLIAPCIVGKSNMFRRSHLNSLTLGGDATRPPGVDYFSYNICEDHLIGDLLWKQKVPEEQGPEPEKIGKHAMLFGDLAIQPMAGMSVLEYAARRIRWLRVRKFTVTLATLVEPGTESFLCSLYAAFAVTTVPFFQTRLGIPPTWFVFATYWILSVSIWATVDWTLYHILHSMGSIEIDENTPAFIRRQAKGQKQRFLEWLPAWIGREALALPIWTWAVLCGTTVNWRGKRFRVGMDMKVHALDEGNGPRSRGGSPSSHANGVHKARLE